MAKLNDKDISVDDKIGIIGNALDARDKIQETITKQITNLNDQITKQDSAIKILQDQMALLQQQNQAVIDFAKVFDPKMMVYKDSMGNLDLGMGKFEAEGITAGEFTVKAVDPDRKTLGRAEIVPADEKGSDGKSVFIKTKSASAGSEIFVTSKVPLEQSLAVTEIKEGEG